MINLSTFKHLLPTGRAWKLTIDKTLRKYFEGLAASLDDFRQYYDGVYEDVWPQTTRALSEWEAQFGLTSGQLTEQERRDRLAAAWQALGGQDPRYIQDTLQNAGFDVYVHEWWLEVNQIQNLQGGVASDGITVIDTISDLSGGTSSNLWNDASTWDDDLIWSDTIGGLSTCTYVENNCLIFSGGTGELSADTITGTEIVESYVGTAVPTIIVGGITFTDGTFFEIKLDNGDHFVACEGAGSVVHNRALPNIWNDPETWNDALIWKDLKDVS